MNKNKELIDQLEEPEKVVIPQFVADYIKDCKETGITLACAYDVRYSSKLADWLYEQCDNINIEVFAKAWLYGYEIEKEPLYSVVFMREPEFERITYLARDKNGCCFINSDNENNPRGIAFLEEAEIEAIDERYMAFALEVTE